MRDELMVVFARAKSSLAALTCVALLAMATGCGPLGDDDEDEEPTAEPPGTALAALDAASPDATPVRRATPTMRATPEADEATPRAAAGGDDEDEETPEAAGDDEDEPPEAEGEQEQADETPTPPEVEDCEAPEELPEVQGAAERQTTDEGVNLRSGPGEDCDVLASLAAATAVEVESGPVRSGDFLWVQVTADGTEGWVAEEFLAPVEE